VKPSHW
jgi:Peptidase family M23